MFLDIAGAASCYRTTGALGVHQKPEEIRNKGVLPYWTMWAGAGLLLALIVAGFIVLPTLGAYGAKAIVGGTGKAIREAVPVARGAVISDGKADGARAVRSVPVPSPAVGPVTGHSMVAARPEKVGEGEVPYPTGILKAGPVIKVTFSDGSVRGNGDPEFGGVRGNWVFAFGRWQPLRGSRHGETSVARRRDSEH